MDVVISLCSSSRKCYWLLRLYHLVIIVFLLLSVTLCLAAAQTAVRNVIQDKLHHDTCQPQISHGVDLQNELVGVVNILHIQGSPSCSSIGNIRSNSVSFCFPIASHNFDAKDYSSCTMPFCWMFPPSLGESNSSWSFCREPLMLLNGVFSRGSDSFKREVNDHPELKKNGNLNSQASSATSSVENIGVVDPGLVHSFSPPHVSISPPLLDWGANYLYAPSFALLTIANTCNNSILSVYEPSSTNPHFFAYNFSEISVDPGKSAIIPFVFLPRWLGLSSAHLVLETNFGGFLVHAKGSAVESPYEIEPLIGLTVSSRRRLRTQLSIYNPFDYTIHVKEIQALSLLSSAGVAYSAHASCRTDASSEIDEVDSPNFKDWFIMKNEQLGVPLMAIKPKRKWEVGSHRTETLMEIELLAHVDGSIFGTFCINLQSSTSQNWSDTVMVPLEVKVDRVAYYSLTRLVSVHIESLGSCENSRPSSVVLSLKNDASHLLSLVEVNEIGSSMKFFQVHYLKGLVLLPGTATHIAVVIYPPSRGSVVLESEIPEISSSCNLQIVTNDSVSPLVEISCRDLITHSCSHYNSDSSIYTSKTYMEYELQDETRKPRNSMTGSLHNIFQVSSPFKVSEIREADELILRGWRFQGTVEGMTILEDHDVSFPMVRVGNHSSKWITVSNPSQYPVIMQLILNPGAVVNNCKGSADLLSHSLVDSMDNTDRLLDIFTVSDSAITETQVPPYGIAFLGPIIFRPSNRCEWRSTGYIRNNLSGLEVLSLHGFGGSQSLILFEGSQHVHALEFNLEVTIPSNVSRSSLLFQTESPSSICSASLSKELFAKNIGDLPLEIERFEVAGNDCGSDGFLIHACKGFALAPGESRRFLISFQTDFSAAVVQRELVLGLATGFLVIPMTATLPLDVLHICRRPLTWGLLRDLSIVAMLAVSIMLFVFCRDLPKVMDSSSQDTSVESGILAQHLKQSHYKEDEISSGLDEFVKAVVLPGNTLVSEDSATVKELTVKIEREKGRRKRRTGGLTGLGGKLEASCSQSGNSTPPSPLSPLMPSTPEQIPDTTNIGFSSQCPSTSITNEMGHRETGILTVNIEGNRRRRKKRAAGSSLKGKFDTSSSQSGNSTPSSPLSPLMSLAHRNACLSPDIGNISKYAPTRKLFQDCEMDRIPKVSSATRLWGPEVIKYYSSSSTPSANEQPSPQKRISGRPVLLPSATFPASGWRGPGNFGTEQILVSHSSAPLVRAPGSKLSKAEMKASSSREGKSENREEFTYDIWGNHFSGLHMMGKSSEIWTKVYNRVDDDSLSFFSRGPQVLIGKASGSVSPVSKLPLYGVHHHNQNG